MAKSAQVLDLLQLSAGSALLALIRQGTFHLHVCCLYRFVLRSATRA